MIYIYLHIYIVGCMQINSLSLGEAVPPAPTRGTLQNLLQADGFGGGIPKIPANLVVPA